MGGVPQRNTIVFLLAPEDTRPLIKSATVRYSSTWSQRCELWNRIAHEWLNLGAVIIAQEGR